jgi:hypothetical protein
LGDLRTVVLVRDDMIRCTYSALAAALPGCEKLDKQFPKTNSALQAVISG